MIPPQSEGLGGRECQLDGTTLGVRRVLAAFAQADSSVAITQSLPRQAAGKQAVTSPRTPHPPPKLVILSTAKDLTSVATRFRKVRAPGVRRLLAAFAQADSSVAITQGLPRQVAGKKAVTSPRTPYPPPNLVILSTAKDLTPVNLFVEKLVPSLQS